MVVKRCIQGTTSLEVRISHAYNLHLCNKTYRKTSRKQHEKCPFRSNNNHSVLLLCTPTPNHTPRSMHNAPIDFGPWHTLHNITKHLSALSSVIQLLRHSNPFLSVPPFDDRNGRDQIGCAVDCATHSSRKNGPKGPRFKAHEN